MKKLLALALWLAAAPAFANSFSPLATSPTPSIPANSINITQPPYNVTSGAADNATALQSAINAAVAANVPLYIPAPASGCYKYTAPLTVSGNLSIVGDWVAGNWAGGINVPLGTPPVTGSVLCPNANGSDALDISGTSLSVSLHNIGFSFQTTFGQSSTTTGDGVHYITTGSTQGLTDPTWENVIVYGHDGNHYAYNLNNAIYGSFVNVRSFGGGGLKEATTAGNFGNQTWVQPFVEVVVGGTGNGYDLSADTAQHLNLITLVRPQAIVNNIAGTTPGANPPTSAQYIWHEDANVRNIGKKCPDFETNVSSPMLLGAEPSNDMDWGCAFSSAAAINAPAWGANGIMTGPLTRTFNDTTSSGTGANTGIFVFPGTHVTATSSTNYPVLGTIYVSPPICGTNCTASRLAAVYSTGEIFTTGDVSTTGGLFISGTSQINKSNNAATEIGDGTTTSAVTIGGPSNLTTLGGTVLAGGAVPTPTGTCAVNTQLGGNLAGSFKANGACAAGTVILTFAKAATTGWACDLHDLTTPGDAMNQTAYATGSATFTGTMVSADLVTFKCEGF